MSTQFWTNENPDDFPFVTKATKFLSMWPETETAEEPQDKMLPYLVTCPIYFSDTPIAVSVVEKQCDIAENKLRIVNNLPKKGEKKKSFGVCCSSFLKDGQGFVINFIEWMEMLRLLGADKITTYKTADYGALEKIAEYYQKKEWLEYTEFNAPTMLRLPPKKNILELLKFTDCFYRNKNLFEYLVVLGNDEILMPVRKEDKTWHDLLKPFKDNNEIASFLSLSTIFASSGLPPNPSIPTYLNMLQQTTRFPKVNGLVKSIVNPDSVITLYEHFGQFCLGDDWCNYETLPPETSLVFRYKSNELKNTTFEDKTILKYQDQLISAVAQTLKETGFKP